MHSCIDLMYIAYTRLNNEIGCMHRIVLNKKMHSSLYTAA